MKIKKKLQKLKLPYSINYEHQKNLRRALLNSKYFEQAELPFYKKLTEVAFNPVILLPVFTASLIVVVSIYYQSTAVNSLDINNNETESTIVQEGQKNISGHETKTELAGNQNINNSEMMNKFNNLYQKGQGKLVKEKEDGTRVFRLVNVFTNDHDVVEFEDRMPYQIELTSVNSSH